MSSELNELSHELWLVYTELKAIDSDLADRVGRVIIRLNRKSNGRKVFECGRSVTETDATA